MKLFLKASSAFVIMGIGHLLGFVWKCLAVGFDRGENDVLALADECEADMKRRRAAR